MKPRADGAILPRLFAAALIVVAVLGLIAAGRAAPGPASRYTGRVLYRGTKTPVAGVLVEIVEAKDDGRPTDEVLGSARVEPDGRFTVTLTNPTDDKVTLTVSAVRTSADSSGDRRGKGYEIKNLRRQLAYLPFPSATRPNTIYVEKRKVGLPPDGNDE